MDCLFNEWGVWEPDPPQVFMVSTREELELRSNHSFQYIMSGEPSKYILHWKKFKISDTEYFARFTTCETTSIRQEELVCIL